MIVGPIGSEAKRQAASVGEQQSDTVADRDALAPRHLVRQGHSGRTRDLGRSRCDAMLDDPCRRRLRTLAPDRRDALALQRRDEIRHHGLGVAGRSSRRSSARSASRRARECAAGACRRASARGHGTRRRRIRLRGGGPADPRPRGRCGTPRSRPAARRGSRVPPGAPSRRARSPIRINSARSAETRARTRRLLRNARSASPAGRSRRGRRGRPSGPAQAGLVRGTPRR